MYFIVDLNNLTELFALIVNILNITEFFPTGLLGDFMSIVVPAEIPWPVNGVVSGFIEIFDWDTISIGESGEHIATSVLTLCSGLLPCSLSIIGYGGGILQRTSNGSIVCDVEYGCAAVTLQAVRIACAEGWTPFLKMYGGMLIIDTGNISDCSSGTNGGLIQGYSGALVDIENSSFYNLHSDASGGAIFVVGAQLRISNSYFYNCTSNLDGGALSAEMYQCSGASAHVNTTVTVDSSTFELCSSMTYGGALSASAGLPSVGGSVDIQLVNSRFLRNWALLSGGAIAVTDYVHTKMIKSVFENNSALVSGGGALFLLDAYLSVVGLSSFGNAASKGGGGLILWQGLFEPQIVAFCPPGKWSALGSNCTQGAFCAPRCASCSSGTYQSKEGGSLPCKSCPAGTFSSAGASYCRNCPVGSYSSALGAIDSSVCIFCSASTYSTSQGATACIHKNRNETTKEDISIRIADDEPSGTKEALKSFHFDEPGFNTELRYGNQLKFRIKRKKGTESRLPRYKIRSKTGKSIVDLYDFQGDFCLENRAMYGQCVASSYKGLKVTGTPSSSNPAFPGLSFNFSVEKQDAYNQRIVTDSSSFLGTSTSIGDTDSVLISGTTVARFTEGVANFSIVLNPTFSYVSFRNFSAVLAGTPSIYLDGFDTQSQQLTSMTSPTIDIVVAQGSMVCPRGYVLMLDEADHGSCSKCGPGTYSLNPLLGDKSQAGSCFSCPPNAVCTGGDKVNFSSGKWVVDNGFYRLVDCPSGHQLINSINFQFDPNVQQCLPCSTSQYIIATNDSKFICQPCPVGARCNGSALIGLVQGSVWVVDDETGQYILVSCPAGYELLATTQDSQQCSLCPPGSYCPGGVSQSVSCQSKTFAPAGANSSDACLPAVFVTISFLLSMDASQFTTDKYKQFQDALAAAGGIVPGRVTVESVTGTSQEQRQLVSTLPSCLVVCSAACENAASAAALTQRLTTDSIDTQLIAQGLSPGFLQSVTIQSPVQQSQPSQAGSIAGAAAGVLLSIILLVACFIIYRKLQFLSSQRAFESSFRNAKAGDELAEYCLPPQLASDYLALEIVGKGTFGVVVKAKQKHGEETIAIKIILPHEGVFLKRELRQLQREGKVLRLFTKSKCEHAVHLSGSDGIHVSPKICWFKMEFLEGEGLDAAVRSQPTCPVGAAECIQVARSVLAALKVMHSEGIVHRDIKPSNIMRCIKYDSVARPVNEPAQWSYKLLDFGTALGIDDQKAHATMMTIDRSILAGVGTAAYMSPEQYNDVENVRYPTDLWSLGVTLFELATGRLPFEADNDFAFGIVIAADMDAPPPSLLDFLHDSSRPSFSNGFASVVTKAMTKRVAKRYQSADEMHEAVYRCLINTGEACYR